MRARSRHGGGEDRAPENNGTDGYVVVHLVVQETTKPLVESQVLDHMEWQASANGSQRPSKVVAAFLEPVRIAIARSLRSHVASLRRRAPSVRLAVWPYFSRLSIRMNTILLAPRLRRYTKGQRIVFHCRGERAVEWAVAFGRHFKGSGIVADIRGPWPDEMLFARGIDDPATAAGEAAREYRVALDRLRQALGAADVVTTVSMGMREWIAGLGVELERVLYVPCCVWGVTFDERRRSEARRELGIDGKLVLAYTGSVSRFQYLVEGLTMLVAEAMKQSETVHLLALTPHLAEMKALLDCGGIDRNRVTLLHVKQPDVARYLVAADAGLLLGGAKRLKAIVQPVKLGEYLAAGLPVVLTRGAVHVDRMIEEYGAGIAVDLPRQGGPALSHTVRRILSEIQQRGPSMRAGALALCQSEFLWSRYTDSVRDGYRRALALAHGRHPSQTS